MAPDVASDVAPEVAPLVGRGDRVVVVLVEVQLGHSFLALVLLSVLLPELVLTVTPEQLAMIAGRAMIPKPPPAVGVSHLHAPQVSVREQALIVVDRLRTDGACTFRDLVRDADSTLVIVARFLALLELFRDALVALDQPEALGELTVRWTGAGTGWTADRLSEDAAGPAAVVAAPDGVPAASGAPA